MTDEELLALVRNHGVPVDLGALAEAVADSDDGFREWVNEHVTPDTLLSKLELETYERIGSHDAIDTSEVLAFDDDEIRNAIAELNKSTHAITQQTQVLRLQQDALAKLISQHHDDGRHDFRNYDAHTSFPSSDTQPPVAELKAAREQFEKRLMQAETCYFKKQDSTQEQLKIILANDDHLLAELQQLAASVELDDPRTQGAIDQMRGLCDRLVKYKTLYIRAVLDRIYSEARRANDNGKIPGTLASADEAGGLREELESLYSEIGPVAQMSVEQHVLDPAIVSLSRGRNHKLEQGLAVLGHIRDCLDYLMQKTLETSRRAAEAQAHDYVLSKIVAVGTREVSALARETSPLKTAAQTLGTARRSSNVGARRRTESSAVRKQDASLPVEQLVDSLTGESPDATSSEDALNAAGNLMKAVHKKTTETIDLDKSTQKNFEIGITQYLADSRKALQLLRDSVLAESPYRDVHIADPEIVSSTKILADEVHDLSKQFEQCHEQQGLVPHKRRTRDNFVKRWGS